MIKKIKITTILLLTLLLTNCDKQPTVEEAVDNALPQPPALNTTFRNKSDPFQMINLGYKMNVGMSRGDTNILFDYEDLGINDSYKSKVQVSALYFPSNDASGAMSKFHYGTVVTYNDAIDNYNWLLFNNKLESYKKTAYMSFFKQAFTYADHPKINFTAVVNRTSVEFYYAPDTVAYPVFKYCLKGLNNGSGQVEVVGWVATNPDGTVETVGDTDLRSPYIPSGFAPPAVID